MTRAPSNGERKNKASRRDFLKFASVSAPVAAASTALGAHAAQADGAGQAEGKLQQTAHMRAYYESLRF